jgi:broad specificity phosphatase PhoE
MIRLIRHAESTFNAAGDRTRDCPLTDHGRRQANEISGTYDCVVCSTMKRTRQTLDASRLVYGQVIFTDLCREIRDGNPINLYLGEREMVETPAQIQARVNEFTDLLRQLQSTYPRIAVISHSGFLREMTGTYFQNAAQKDYSLATRNPNGLGGLDSIRNRLSAFILKP